MMTGYTRAEIAVGFFVLAGFAALAYLSVSLGGLSLFAPPGYHVSARFASVGALQPGAAVKIAGVEVGSVESVELTDYVANARLEIRRGIVLPSDTIASIRTEGLLGESFISLSPGASERDLADGGQIGQTEPAIDLIELVSKYAFDSDDEPSPSSGEGEGGVIEDPFELDE